MLHMKCRTLLTGTLALLFWAGTALTSAWAEQQPQYEEISSYEVDVTGDGKNDRVSLFGKRSEQGSPFYRALHVLVENPVTQKQTVFTSTEGGYGPKLEFCDVTGDKVNDILLSADTGGSGGIVNYSLYSAKADKAVTLPVPPALTISGKFANKYKANVTVAETRKTYTIDLRERKATYDEMGLYKDGKLVKPTDVMSNTAYQLLKPVDMNRDGVCELQGVQRVAGAFNADTIAYVTSLWKWQRNKWTLQDVQVQKAGQ